MFVFPRRDAAVPQYRTAYARNAGLPFYPNDTERDTETVRMHGTLVRGGGIISSIYPRDQTSCRDITCPAEALLALLPAKWSRVDGIP